MQYSSNEAAVMNQPKQDCLPSTPLRRESCSVASAGVATFHDDSQDMMFKLDRVPSRRESLQLDQLKGFKRSLSKRRNGGGTDSSRKSFASSWQSMGSSLSSVFSSVRSLNIVVLDDEAAEYQGEHTFPSLGRRSSVNKENSARQMHLQWQRTEEVAGCLQAPRQPKRRASWGWKKSSLHSNATSSAGTKSRRSSLRSSLTSWTPSRGRRSSSGSITTQSPPLVNEHLLQLNSGGEQDTFPLRPWRRASLTSIGIPVERIVEGGELEEQGSSNFSLGLSNHTSSHRWAQGEETKDTDEEDDNDEFQEDDEEAPAPRCSETTRKITNAAAMARPSYLFEEDEWPLEEPKLIARASAVTVKATNSVDSSKSSRFHARCHDDKHGLMKEDDGAMCRWAGGTTTTNREERASISIPIRLESAHTISTDC